MATELTPQNVTPGSAVTSAAADATGNYVRPDGRPIAIRINNGSGSTITVTLNDPTTVVPEGSPVTTPAVWPDLAFTIAAGAARYILLDRARRARFTDPTTLQVLWTYSAVTSVTVECVIAGP